MQIFFSVALNSRLVSEYVALGLCFVTQGSIHSLFLYDAVYLYMTMMEHFVTEGLDWRNGTLWLQTSCNWVTEGL